MNAVQLNQNLVSGNEFSSLIENWTSLLQQLPNSKPPFRITKYDKIYEGPLEGSQGVIESADLVDVNKMYFGEAENGSLCFQVTINDIDDRGREGSGSLFQFWCKEDDIYRCYQLSVWFYSQYQV